MRGILRNGTRLDLSLDVNAREGCGTWTFEKSAGLARQEYDLALAVLEEALAVMVEDKLCCIGIRLKVQLLSNEAQRHVRFVSKEKC